MPIVQLVSSIISSIAWPVVGIIALLVFKGPIQQAVSGKSGGRPLRRVKAGSFEVEWEQLDKTEQEISETPPPKEAKSDKSKESPGPDQPESDNPEDRNGRGSSRNGVSDLYELAHSFPAAAILLAFKRVEKRTLEVASKLDVTPSDMRSSRDRQWRGSMKGLLHAEAVDSRTANGFDSLRTIRNQVTHAQSEEEVTSARAVQYLMVANDVLAALSVAEQL